VQAALDGEIERREARAPFTRASTGQQGPDTDLFQVFVPLRAAAGEEVVGAVQVDFLADALRSAAAGPWPSIQLALGLALLVCLGMTVVLWVPLRRADATAEETEDAADPEPAAVVGMSRHPTRQARGSRSASPSSRAASPRRRRRRGGTRVLAAAAPPSGDRRGSDDPKVLLQTLAGREEDENEEGADLRMRLGRAVDLKMMRDKDR